ncbi:hypothetical protein SLS62_001340 [Diatrype stigma]|uniref:Thioesterase domain-containing protein n=1 Tax=Diatrype stigma TaxID=117547 RepID=A0AAN9UZ06_9PEZI
MLRSRIPQKLCRRQPMSHPVPAARLYAPLPPRFTASLPIRLPTQPCRLLSTSPQCFRKAPLESAPPPPPSSDQQTTAIPPQKPRPTPGSERPPWRRRGVLYAAAFLMLGTILGSVFRVTVSPPDLAEPGSAEDRALLGIIRRKAEALPLVRELSEDPAWDSWDAYSVLPDADAGAGAEGEGQQRRRDQRLTSGALAGSRGLAYQRVFRRADTGECATVVYFGGGTAGWPGLVHGGALATVLDESLGRCAILRFPARTGVTARLELAYRAPTRAESFYVVRARPVESDVGGKKKSDADRKLWVEGSVETLDGSRVLVDARALFVVPKGVKLAPLAVGF